MAFATTKTYKGPTVDFSALKPGDVFRFFYPARDKMVAMLSDGAFVLRDDGMFISAPNPFTADPTTKHRRSGPTQHSARGAQGRLVVGFTANTVPPQFGHAPTS